MDRKFNMFVAVRCFNVTAVIRTKKNDVNKQDIHLKTFVKWKKKKSVPFKYLNHKQELWVLYFTSIPQFGFHFLSKCQSRHHRFNKYTYCFADSLTNNKSALFSSPEKDTALTHTVYLNRSFPGIRNKKKSFRLVPLSSILSLYNKPCSRETTLSCTTHKMKW